MNDKTAIAIAALTNASLARMQHMQNEYTKALLDAFAFGTSAPFVYRDDEGVSLANALRVARSRP